LAQRLARAAAPRVALGERLRVLHRGSLLRGDLTLTEAGIRALDRVDVLAEVDGG